MFEDSSDARRIRAAAAIKKILEAADGKSDDKDDDLSEEALQEAIEEAVMKTSGVVRIVTAGFNEAIKQIIESEAIGSMAKLVAELRNALCEEGFTGDEAIALITGMIGNLNKVTGAAGRER